ncbi:uncharacterized protein C8R40DRAFT_1050402, partial [Lentinula edodes]|uniref:uncharacterized protein n=1 Tax=Lentinula edodes TaxID=5353 RepID=UPI001E8DE29E
MDSFVLANTPQSRFTYICKELDGLLLDKKGIRTVDIECCSFELYLCHSCNSSLQRSVMPRLALNNFLYRGELIDELKNVTWVEEMACSLYHTTAHVSRIYGSSDDSDPLQLHGNVCAHPLNICSIAKRLPWSPADLNDLITIVFVSKTKLRSQDLQKLKPYFVRRRIIRMLLSELYKHNRLYAGMNVMDNSTLSMYPENGLLPGLEERIVYDHE